VPAFVPAEPSAAGKQFLALVGGNIDYLPDPNSAYLTLSHFTGPDRN
jgi:hypothetical protein